MNEDFFHTFLELSLYRLAGIFEFSANLDTILSYLSVVSPYVSQSCRWDMAI
jgi:hypothetical protein